MKTEIKHLLLSFFTAAAFVVLNGCVNVEETIYLGDVKVNGPLMTPPEHINNNKHLGDVTISPRFSAISNTKKITGTTDDRYTGSFNFPDQSKYSANRENLEWNLSPYNVGADIDIAVSRSFSIFGGLIVSAGKNNTSFTGGNFGIGLRSTDNDQTLRVDFGLNIHEFDYYAVTIVQTKETSLFGSKQYTNIYCDKGNSVNINPFLTLSVYSSSARNLINYSGSLGFFTQSLLDFNPGETNYEYFPLIYEKTTVDRRANYTAYFFYLAPGLIFTINPQMNLTVSAKILKEFLSDSGGIIAIPSVQMDFHF